MNEHNESLEKENFTMFDAKYEKWFSTNWNTQGGLIPQAQASKILGKTPTRIRQMINEGKLKSFVYKDETPLVSFAEIKQIKEKEDQRFEEIEEAKLTDYDRYRIEEQQEENQEAYENYVASLPEVPQEVKEIIEQQAKELEALNALKKKLQRQLEELEDKISSRTMMD
ncbi:MAG: hypothetical protein PHE96_11285 [Methylococcales bacterium]|nr:hypothetical protein [Methylococcales bacterium]